MVDARRHSLGVLLLELLNGKSLTHASLQDGDGGTLDLPRLVQSVVREECTAEVIGVELVRLGAAPRRRWTRYRRHRRSYDSELQLSEFSVQCPQQRASII